MIRFECEQPERPKFTIHDKIRVRNSARIASMVVGRTILCLEWNGSYFYCDPCDLPYLNYRKIIGAFKNGQAVHKYTI